MQHSFAVVCALAALWPLAAFGHPVDDVISLLKGLSEKTKAEGQAEELTYAKFEHWCKNSKKTLSAAIAKGKADAEALESGIAGKKETASVLEKEIAGLEEEIGKIDAATLKADAQRKDGATLYAMADQDYASTIQAIDDALVALTESKTSTTGLVVAQQRLRKIAALAFMSKSSTSAQREALQEFLGQPEARAPAPAERPDLEAEGDYGAHVKKYSFKSDSVIELLKALKAKFEEEKLGATKEETNSLNAHSLSSDARANAKLAAGNSKDAKTSELATVKDELATAEAELEEVMSDLDSDSKLLEATDKQCAVKASEWGARSDTRQKEVEAIEAAVGILSKVTGVRTEAPSNPVPPASPLEASEPSSFLQVSGADPKQRAVQLLKKEAHELHSRALERLAQEVAMHSTGPFDEVNNMIQKMIQRLMSEQTDEDNHKNWCDQELTTNNVSKTQKEDKIAMLSAKIEKGTATAQVRTSEIQANSEMLEAIALHVAEATEIRETGKSENAAAEKDSQDAQTALANAISVLEAHYKETGMMKKEAWEFVQRGVELPEEPSTWDSGYTGVADPAAQPGGIISVLKTVSADFAKMEAETRAQEETDSRAYEEDMKRSEIEKARRLKESDMKSQEKKRLLEKVESHSKVHKQTSSDLEKVNQYIADLQHACVDGDSTYDDRKAARAKEITALHEAQDILAQAFAAGPAPAPAAAFLAPASRLA